MPAKAFDATTVSSFDCSLTWTPAPGAAHRDVAGRASPLAIEPVPDGLLPFEFQHLLTTISARFGSIEPDAVDDAIADSLRESGERVLLDMAILWRTSADEAVRVPAKHWIRAPFASAPEPVPITSMPMVMSRIAAREQYAFARVDDVPHAIDRGTFDRLGLRAGVITPIAKDEGGSTLTLAFGSMTREETWAPQILDGLQWFAGVVSQAVSRRGEHTALQRALSEIQQLRDRLATQSVELRHEIKLLRTSQPIVSESTAIQRTIAQGQQVAPTPATVVLLGDAGVGKEVIAQTIHDLSPRRQRTMVRVSCAAIPTALIESELFGRERGAYTGALSRQIGRFEAANQSTLFLDEIGDLPTEVQVKLLRVLQDRVLERLGSTQPIKVDVRIIAATNRNLDDAVRDKMFREDLFY